MSGERALAGAMAGAMLSRMMGKQTVRWQWVRYKRFEGWGGGGAVTALRQGWNYLQRK